MEKELREFLEEQKQRELLILEQMLGLGSYSTAEEEAVEVNPNGESYAVRFKEKKFGLFW